jgi:hypothetical protein
VGNVEFAVFSDMTVELAPVLPENHAPTITSNGGGDSAVVTVEEGMTVVTTVTATDPDPGTALSYYIFSSPNANLFQFDANGNLSFITPPDYDDGQANTYVVQVGVSDGELLDQQTLTIEVTDVPENAPEGRGNVLGPDGVLWMHQDGTVAIGTTELESVASGWQIVGVGDFDRDGDSDVLFRHDDGRTATWELEGGHFLADHGFGVVPDTWRVVGTGDFDRDGDSDILWRHRDGHVVNWEMEGGSYVVNHNLPDVPATWQMAGTGDFDHDGDADILWRHQDGQVVTWEMENGTYVVNHNLAEVPHTWRIAGTGDFDADGDADFLWRHNDGLLVSWEMEDGAFVVNHNLATTEAGWQFGGAQDFDHDGDADLLFRHDSGMVATWNVQDLSLLQSHNYGGVESGWHIRGTGEFGIA